METSIVIFIISILLTIISWLAQKMLNQILTEIKDIHEDMLKLTDSYIRAKAVIDNLPCRIRPNSCIYESNK